MEPKYKVGDWIEHEDGYLVRIGAILESTDGEPRYGVMLGDHSLYTEGVYEGQIIRAVRIIPIVDKPKCKDCQFYFDEGKYGAAGLTKECPIWIWSWKFFNDLPSLEDNDGNDLEPPDGSTCFRPKVGHEQQEAK